MWTTRQILVFLSNFQCEQQMIPGLSATGHRRDGRPDCCCKVSKLPFYILQSISSSDNVDHLWAGNWWRKPPTWIQTGEKIFAQSWLDDENIILTSFDLLVKRHIEYELEETHYRVAIWGWSYGGFATALTLEQGARSQPLSFKMNPFQCKSAITKPCKLKYM